MKLGRGCTKIGTTFNKSTYLDLIDKFVVLKELHQTSCTAGGLYGGPHARICLLRCNRLF